MICFNCPYCNQNYEMSEVTEGQHLQCCNCNKKFAFSNDLIRQDEPVKPLEADKKISKKSIFPYLVSLIVVCAVLLLAYFTLLKKDKTTPVSRDTSTSSLVVLDSKTKSTKLPQNSQTAKPDKPAVLKEKHGALPPMSDTWPVDVKADYLEIAEKEKALYAKLGDREKAFSVHRKKLLNGVKEMAHPKTSKSGWLSVYRPAGFAVACHKEII